MEEERKRMAVATEAVDCGTKRLQTKDVVKISVSIWDIH